MVYNIRQHVYRKVFLSVCGPLCKEKRTSLDCQTFGLCRYGRKLMKVLGEGNGGRIL